MLKSINIYFARLTNLNNYVNIFCVVSPFSQTGRKEQSMWIVIVGAAIFCTLMIILNECSDSEKNDDDNDDDSVR